mgnify:CR=1 FL=1
MEAVATKSEGKVAEKLGLELYDRDLIDRAAEKIIAMPKDVLGKKQMRKSVIRGCMRYGMMCRTRN